MLENKYDKDGITFEQSSYNHHIWGTIDDEFVIHYSCNKKLSEQELENLAQNARILRASFNTYFSKKFGKDLKK